MRPHLPDWRKLLFDLMWSTGLRVSEALGIARANIARDGQGRWIMEVQGVKGEKLDKVLVSPDLARRLLAYYRPRHRRDKRVLPFSVEACQKALARACERAGVRHIHPHLVRHSFAVNYARRPVNISALEHRLRLRDLLGHKTIESAEPYFSPNQEDVLGYWEERVNEETAPAGLDRPKEQNAEEESAFRKALRKALST